MQIFKIRVSFSSLLVVLGSMFLLTSSCTFAPQKRPPEKAAPTDLQIFNSAHKDFNNKRTVRAIKKLNGLTQRNPGTDIADDAFMLLGKIYYKIGNYEKAYSAYINVVNAEVFSPEEGQALYNASLALSKLGRYNEALSLTERCLNFKDLPEALVSNVYKLRYFLFTQLGDRLDALQTLTVLYNFETDTTQKEKYRLSAIDYVESQLTQEELVKVAENSSFGFLRGYALFHVGIAAFEQKDFSKAVDYLEEVVKTLPETDMADQASSMLFQIEARRKVAPYTIGVVLPLSGHKRDQWMAQKTLRGLQLGLGIFGSERSLFNLSVIDSKSNPDASRRAVEKLVTEDHVIAIVGSLLSKTAVAVSSKADELGVPNITLSQKAGITEIGNNVFRNALTSEMQVQNIVEAAMVHGKMKKFAVLFPNDAYGVEFTNLFWDEVKNRGGEIVGAQPYEPGTTDFDGPVRRLVGTFYVEDRIDEYKLRLKKWFKKQKSFNMRITPPKDLLPPVVDFDAIFVPDDIRAIGQIAPMLAYHDISEIKLIGTRVWNTPGLIARGGSYVEDSIFADGLLPTDIGFKNSSFYLSYKKTFGTTPRLMDAEAYDIGILLRRLIEGGENTRIGLAQALKNTTNFQGSLGNLQMNPQRELRRPIFSLTVKEGQITVSN